MKTVQYTIRSVPQSLDVFLRRQARTHGKSLNRLVLDYIEQATKLEREQPDDTFSWIIGANTLDEPTLQAIDELHQIDKRTSRV